MATQPKTYTYEDLLRFPEDNMRREIIDGDLVVTAAPPTRHQRVVLGLGAAILAYARERGGDVYVAPTDVYFSPTNVAEPDVLYVRPEHMERVETALVRSAPDMVVEVSSPSTRRLDLIRKRELYERFRVPEYWYVDLDADRVEVYRLEGDRYATPELRGRGEVLDSAQAPGFSIDIDELLGPAERA